MTKTLSAQNISPARQAHTDDNYEEYIPDEAFIRGDADRNSERYQNGAR